MARGDPWVARGEVAEPADRQQDDARADRHAERVELSAARDQDAGGGEEGERREEPGPADQVRKGGVGATAHDAQGVEPYGEPKEGTDRGDPEDPQVATVPREETAYLRGAGGPAPL